MEKMKIKTRKKKKDKKILSRFLNFVERAGIGSVIALMLPYTIAFFLVWSGLLVIWMVLGIPVGPGAPIHLVP